jgi:hypothetical protein
MFVHQSTLLRILKQPTEWKKIFVTYIAEKGLLSRKCKSYYNAIKKINNPI